MYVIFSTYVMIQFYNKIYEYYYYITKMKTYHKIIKEKKK